MTETRLGASNPAQSIAITRQAKTNPIHFLYQDVELEQSMSSGFKAAFGEDLIVHRGAGKEVPLYVGTEVKLEPGRRWPSREYWEKVEAMPPLKTQGDGMRSFVGVLLYATVVDYSVVLIDEPEAFLHPPQARLLSRMLVQKKKKDSQLFLATHSADVIRGLLDAGSSSVRIVRLLRRGDVNYARSLRTDEVKTLWADPLLRYSNVLDGLFHDNVVVCESDADCRFYEAVAVAVAEKEEDNRRMPCSFTAAENNAWSPW
jgi:AAA domain, putative AbiEii toxin, Type IV TA system